MMKTSNQMPMTCRERVAAILKGEAPDKIPFIDRMELWFRHHREAQTMPENLNGMDLNRIHAEVGMGRQKFVMPLALKFHGVEMEVIHNGEPLFTESEPVYSEFPANNAPDFVPRERAGETEIEFITPKGKLGLKFIVTESMAASKGVEPYLTEHLIKQDDDYAVTEWMLEKSEIVPRFDRLETADTDVGENGFVVPRVHRIPFQQALLEYLGEVPLFTALYDNRSRLNRLINILDEQVTAMIEFYKDSDTLVVQFPDNLDGMMTNPNLFKEYCLPAYQKYADLLHAQNKLMCSHVDGNLKPIYELLPESGLDVFESFSPWPLTELRFSEAFEAWCGPGIIWGGIPSPILEKPTGDNEFKVFIEKLFQTIGDRPIILGIGDQVMPGSILDRVRYISEMIENMQM